MEMALISNLPAAYSFISLLVSGMCIRLLLTLVALDVRISCQTDFKCSTVKKTTRKQDNCSDSSNDNSDTISNLSAGQDHRFERILNMNVFASTKELEQAQRLEEWEWIIREIWVNGLPDIPGTRSLNHYY
ncbi:protein eva-1 homolog A-like [Lissotriton helveticus]